MAGDSRAIVVVNPASSRARGERDLRTVLRPFKERGWSVAIKFTSRQGEATTLTREAVAAGYRAVIAAGGDGTVNEIVQGLPNSDTALGVLPLGMENLWANEIGLPMDPFAAAQALAGGETRRFDLGVADWQDNGRRYFLLMAGIGFDAEAVRRTSARSKRLLGPTAFVLHGLITAMGDFGPYLTVELPTGTIERRAVMLLASNTRRYAGGTQIAPLALADDGLLDVCIFSGNGFLTVARYTGELLIGRHLDNPTAYYAQVPWLGVRSVQPLPVQLDGEDAGVTPVKLSILPLALRALVPAGSGPGAR